MRWLMILLIPSVLGSGWVLTARHSSGSADSRADDQTAAIDTPRPIFANGFVEGSQREVQLGFEVTGRVNVVLVHEGQSARQGDVLATLEAGTWQAAVEQAAARLTLAEAERTRLINAASAETRAVAHARIAVAEARLGQARDDLERGEQLLSRKAITTQEWQHLEHAHKVAQAELDLARTSAAELIAAARADDIRIADAKIALAKAALREAQAVLAKAQLVAPCDGRVLRLDIEPGQLVGDGQAAETVTFACDGQLHVRAYLEELDALRVEVGRRATVTADGLPGESVSATVVECAPYLTQKRTRHDLPGERIDTRLREVRLRLDRPAGLLIGLPVEVLIDTQQHADPEPVDSETDSEAVIEASQELARGSDL